MITTNNGSGSILYSFQANEIQVTDNTDLTKKGQFDISQVPTNSTVVLAFPSTSTTLVGVDTNQTLTNKTISGSNNTLSNISISAFLGALGFGTGELLNSNFTINNSNVKSTSTIIACYQNITNAIDIETVGPLFISNIVPNTSFTVSSSHTLDQNAFFWIAIW